MMTTKLNFYLIVFMIFASCNKKPMNMYNHYIENAKILDIASQYGFTKNNVTVKQKASYPVLSFLDSAYVRCCSEASLREDFKNLKEILEKDDMIRKEDSIFNIKKYSIKSVKDYYDLVNSLPLRKAAAIEAAGGEAEYTIKVEQESKKNLHIYIAKDGVVTFVIPELDKDFDTPDGRYPGKRLDTMKD